MQDWSKSKTKVTNQDHAMITVLLFELQVLVVTIALNVKKISNLKNSSDQEVAYM